jgi:formate/nitrite transporter
LASIDLVHLERRTMDYVKPADVVSAMIAAGKTKAALSSRDLLIRGILSGMLLGAATSLAFGATLSTGQPIVGALIFPVGFVMIVLLGLELVTGSFAVVPLAKFEGSATSRTVIANWTWVFLGNLVGSVLYGALFAIALTNMGTAAPAGVAASVIKIAEAKTVGYEAMGFAGMVTAFVKAMLCNWLVCLGVVMAMTSGSTVGKIAAAWLPIVTFFAQGYEHSVVNMFVIPTGMMMGAKVSVYEWWVWNQIPVTLGNLAGGLLFTGLALYATYRPASAMPAMPAAATQPAE